MSLTTLVISVEPSEDSAASHKVVQFIQVLKHTMQIDTICPIANIVGKNIKSIIKIQTIRLFRLEETFNGA